MQYALYKGIEVDALKEKASKRVYHCPTCSETVAIRKGDKNIHHFYHLNVEESLNCDNYHPGTNNSNNSHYYDRKKLNEPRLKLIRNFTGACTLYLITPKPRPDSSGYISINHTKEGSIKRFLNDTLATNFNVVVDFCETPYTITCSDDAEFSYKQSLIKEIKGLSPQGNVFKNSSHQGGLQDRNEKIILGDEYYFVQKFFEIEVPDTFKKIDEDSDNKWDIFSFKCDESQSKFLSSLGYFIAEPDPRLELIYPISIMKDGVINIPKGIDPIFQVTNNENNASIYINVEYSNTQQPPFLLQRPDRPFKLSLPLSATISVNSKSTFKCNLVQDKIESCIPSPCFTFEDQRKVLFSKETIDLLIKPEGVDMNFTFQYIMDIEIGLIIKKQNEFIINSNRLKLSHNDSSIVDLKEWLEEILDPDFDEGILYLYKKDNRTNYTPDSLPIDPSIKPVSFYNAQNTDPVKSDLKRNEWLNYISTRSPTILSTKELKWGQV